MALNDTLSIDIARRGTIHIPAKQADHGYDIICTILQNGENIVDASTDTATFREQKPDGTAYYGDATVNSDNTVTIHVDDDGQMLAAAGFAIVDLSIETGGVVKSTQNFVLDIQAAPGGSALESSSVFANLQHMYNTLAGLWGQAPAIGESVAKTAVASFSDGADGYALKDLTAYIEPVQDLSNGDPSPTNICPITGWTAAKVTRTGLNLVGDGNIVDGEGYNANGETEINAARFRTEKIKCEGENYITVGWTNGDVSANAIRVIWDKNGNVINRAVPATASVGGRRYYSTDISTFTGACYIAFAFYADGGALAQENATEVMVNFGNTPLTYEAGDVDSISIDWTDEAGTVYGGTLDVTTGKLTVERAMVDLGTLTWSKVGNSNYRTFNARLTGVLYNSSVPTIISEIYKSECNGTALASDDKYIWCDSTNHIAIKDTSKASMTATEFKASMSGVLLVYKLITPVVYDLTPTEVTTLLGTNNVWADTGDVSVDYVADTKTYIDNAIAAAINA